MKKAIKINLSGMVFHIDEDAFEKLKVYLDTIGKYFSNKEEAEEIMNDIEARIGELFQEKMPKVEKVISLKLVNEVIEIMGDPEEIFDIGEEKSQEGKSFRAGSYRTKNRRLYRDPENAVISGVSGGLGAYFNIDPIIVRILFVVFFFFGGASVIVYPILWIVIPKAETAAQKLEMRGEPVNISNIEKKVREEYESAKENVKAAANSETVKKTKKATRNFFSELGKILLVFIKVFLIIIGTALVLSGIGIIIGLLSGTFMGLHFFPFNNYDFSLGELLHPFADPISVSLLMISVTVLILIPIIAMIYGLIKLIFNIKSKNKGLTVGAVSLWFIALVMTIGILAMESLNYSDSGSVSSQNNISIQSDTLIVAVNNNQVRKFEKDLVFDFDLDSEWFITENLDRIYGRVDLDIERSSSSAIQLDIEKKSKGRNWDDAETNAANLNYSYSQNGNVLELNPYFYLDGDDNWRFPRVNITLEIPEGTVIILEKNTRDILDDVYNTNHMSDWKMSGKTWIMERNGLKLVEE